MTAFPGAGSSPSVRLAALLLGAVACANIEAPPGGPPDQAPPYLVGTIPESLGVFPDFDDEVEFVFNEVISEGSSPNLGFGTGTLEQLIRLSPGDAVPRVDWKRTRIGVRPRGGWRPNTVYRVELLPGITDVSRNRSEVSRVLTFATGGPPPTDTLRGLVIDWTQGRPSAGALLLATLLPDSLTYRASTDSAGRFAFGPLPRGAWLIEGLVDQNNNRRRDSREAFDTVSVAPDSTNVGTLWMFPRDTTGPRVAQITVIDSLSIMITFSQFLDPYQQVDSSAARVVLLPDSIPVAVRSLLPQAAHDSLYPRTPPPDSTALDSLAVDSVTVDSADAAAPPGPPLPPGARDTLPRAVIGAPDSLPAQDPGAGPPAGPPPVAGPGARGGVDPAVQAVLDERPALFDRLILRLAQPMVADGRYFVETLGIRNVNGVAGDGGAGFVAPPPPPPPLPPADSLGQNGDSLAPAPDSLAPVPDSLVAPDSAAAAEPAPEGGADP